MGEGQSRVYYDGPTDNSNKLISAASKGQTEVVAKLLTKRGKKIGKRDERGDTALHKAAAMGHVEVVQQLLAKGADVGVRNVDGFTPFHLAVMFGRKRCCKVLLEAFKDIKDELLSDPFPKNPGIFLDYSVEGKFLKIAESLIF
jgi:ankyrin repeat protein